MTNPTPTPSTSTPMQFDKAVTRDGAATAPGVVCSMCGTRIVDRYWTLGDQPACVSCKATVQREAAAAKRTSVFVRSSLFGFGAAVAGAVLYYAVLKLLHLEIALVAIAIGYMVGRAMRTGARGWGGRRFQIAAAGLTYLSVGLAYMPIAFESATAGKKSAAADSTTVSQQGTVAAGDSTAFVAQDSTAGADSTVAAGNVGADSTAVAAEDSAAAVDSAAVPVKSNVSTADVKSAGIGTVLLGIGATFALSLALPIIIILGSLPGGLISALIIGFGIRQAWRMTAGTDLTFQGPLTVAKG